MTTETLHHIADRLARLEARVEALINPPTAEDVLRAVWVARGEDWFTCREIIDHALTSAADLGVTLLRADCATPRKLGQCLASTLANPQNAPKGQNVPSGGSFDLQRGGREGGGHRWRIVLCKVGALT
jgi:hypothetical protein